MTRNDSSKIMIGGMDLEQKRPDSRGTEGRLPSMAPLANPYVPFQPENPPKYDARFGLVRGTIFPGLDLPFMNMSNQKERPVTPTTELQALAFAVNELALYLDTHPNDIEATEMYQTYQQALHDGMMEYSKEEGPLNHTVPAKKGRYCWPMDPWPWEYAANKED